MSLYFYKDFRVAKTSAFSISLFAEQILYQIKDTFGILFFVLKILHSAKDLRSPPFREGFAYSVVPFREGSRGTSAEPVER